MAGISSPPRAEPRVSLWVAAALVVAVTIVDPLGQAPFGPIKWAAITTLALIATSSLTVHSRLEIDRLSAVGWVMFLLWGGGVSLFALDPLYTWIGTPDRHLGLLAWIVFALLFVVGQTLTSKSQIDVMVRSAVIALLLTGVYSTLELVGLDLVRIAGETSRLRGPFGNAAYLGAACSLLLPISIAVAVSRRSTLQWRAIAIAASMLGGIAAVGSQTRAAWVGLAVAALVTAPQWWRVVARQRWLGAGLLGLVLVLASTPLAGRFLDTLDLESPSTQGRIDEWRVGMSVLAAHPIVGVGFEGYRIAFAEGVDAEYERRYTRQFIPDRTHNGALDVGITTGMPGMALYLAGHAWLASRTLKAIRTGDHLLRGIAAGLVAYGVQQQFLFPLAELDPVFWVFAGVVVAATGTSGTRLTVRMPQMAAVVAGILAAGALVAGALDIAADHRLRTAVDLSSDGQHDRALRAVDRSVTLRPDSIRYGFAAAAIAAEAGDSTALDQGLTRLDTALELSPLDPALQQLRAELLVKRAQLTLDPDAIETAASYLRAMTTRDPFNAELQLLFGVASVLNADLEQAELAWLTAEHLAPTSIAPPVSLAALYLDLGQVDAARTALTRAIEIDPENPTVVELMREIDQRGPSPDLSS